MKRFGLLALACLMTLAFTTQLDAGFRVRPVPDESTGEEHDEAGGEGHDENEGGGGDQRNPMMEMVRRLMQRFDRNRDRGLSFREAPKWLKKKFSEVDSNRDGQIDAKELMEMLGNKPEDEDRPDHPPKHPRPKDNTPPPQY